MQNKKNFIHISPVWLVVQRRKAVMDAGGTEPIDGLA